MREHVAAPLERAPSGGGRSARPRAREGGRRELAALDRDEVRRRLADEDVLDVFGPAAAGRDEESVRESPAGGENEAAGRVHRAIRQRVLRRETGVGLAFSRAAQVVAFRLELAAVRERVRARRDGLRLQRFDLVVAFGSHLRRDDPVEVLVEVQAIDDVQRAARIRENEEAAAVRLLLERNAPGHARTGRRGKDLDRRGQTSRRAVLGSGDDDRRRAGRGSSGGSLEHDRIPSGAAHLCGERFRGDAGIEASEQNSVDAAVRRERDRAGDLQVRRELLERAARRLLLRERGGLHREARGARRDAFRTEHDRTAEELRASAGDHGPRLARGSIRELGQVALQSDAIEDPARKRGRRNRDGRRRAAAPASLGDRGRRRGGRRSRRGSCRRLRGRPGRASRHPRDRDEEKCRGKESRPVQKRDRTWVPRISFR